MNEKIYLIVRSMTNRNKIEQYVLKKFDIIKLGRVKFKVKDIFIKKIDEATKARRKVLRKREELWRKKEEEKAKVVQKAATLFRSSPMKKKSK